MARQSNHFVVNDPQFAVPVRLASELADNSWFCRLCPSEGKTTEEMKEHLVEHIELIPNSAWSDKFSRTFNAR
jgi:hypothetical protein